MSEKDLKADAIKRKYEVFLADLRNSAYYENESRLCMGWGDPNSEVVLIGEAPGADEVKNGRPFVGAAGKKLTGFLDMIGINRENVFITNAVKFRPIKLSVKTNKPVNRKPSREEVAFCLPLLLDELEVIRPRLIVVLGSVPLSALMPDAKIGEAHGQATTYNDAVLFPLYHPAAVIYNQSLKSVYEEDVRRLGALNILHSIEGDLK